MLELNFSKTKLRIVILGWINDQNNPYFCSLAIDLIRWNLLLFPLILKLPVKIPLYCQFRNFKFR